MLLKEQPYFSELRSSGILYHLLLCFHWPFSNHFPRLLDNVLESFIFAEHALSMYIRCSQERRSQLNVGTDQFSPAAPTRISRKVLIQFLLGFLSTSKENSSCQLLPTSNIFRLQYRSKAQPAEFSNVLLLWVKSNNNKKDQLKKCDLESFATRLCYNDRFPTLDPWSCRQWA